MNASSLGAGMVLIGGVALSVTAWGRMIAPPELTQLAAGLSLVLHSAIYFDSRRARS